MWRENRCQFHSRFRTDTFKIPRIKTKSARFEPMYRATPLHPDQSKDTRTFKNTKNTKNGLMSTRVPPPKPGGGVDSLLPHIAVAASPPTGFG